MNHLVKSLAGVLLGVLAVVGCQREKEVTNPNYNPETGEVNTKFIFSVSTGDYQDTKQTAANTQATTDQTFRGFERSYLVAYKQEADGKMVTNDADSYNKWISLGQLVSPGYFDPNAGTTHSGKPQSRRIVELPLAEGVNSFVFYAKAPKTGTNAQQGSVTLVGSRDNLADVRGVAGTIMPTKGTADSVLFFQSYELIALIFNHIINTGINGSNSDDKITGVVLHPTYDNKTFVNALTWKDYMLAKNANPSYSPISDNETKYEFTALEEILATAYSKIVTLTTGEVRAGSGSAVARTIGDLLTTIKKVASAEPTSLQEEVAKQFAIKIRNRIQLYFEGEGSACIWKDVTTIRNNLITNARDAVFTDQTIDTRFMALATESSTSSSTKGQLDRFPLNFGIPAGAAVLNFDSTPTAAGHSSDTPAGYTKYDNFYYNFTSIDVSGMGMGETRVGADHYIYPTELCYWGNSPIRVNSAANLPQSAYPDGSVDWENDNSWSATAGWVSNSHIESSTTNVAMMYNVHYATALLQSTVRYGVATLEDNNRGIHPTEQPKTINVSGTDGEGAFLFTGLIIGGQPNQVGWDFLAPSGSSFNYMIYDGDVPSTAIPAYDGEKAAVQRDSSPNYTLVFDNYDSSKAANAQSPVYIGVELVNNTGKDFWGLHNVVRAGGTFYIIGKLDPATLDGDNFKLTAGYHLPPYTAQGESNPVKRVFVQSFKTEAHFELGVNSLKNAYVTVPDLRSSELSLGLSVKLNWVPGVNFDSVVLGAL